MKIFLYQKFSNQKTSSTLNIQILTLITNGELISSQNIFQSIQQSETQHQQFQMKQIINFCEPQMGEKQYLFSLYATSNLSKRKDIEINYSPLFNETMDCKINIIPIFNNNNDPSQPGFILELDKSLHQQHSQQYRLQYEIKYKELTSKSKIMNVPKPKSISKFCNLCKLYYVEYLDHIQSRAHKASFKKNSCINKIQQIANDFKQQESVAYTIEQSESTEIEQRKAKRVRY